MEKCMRKAIVFMRNSAIRKALISVFQRFLLVSGGRGLWVSGGDWTLDYNSLEFSDFPDLS